MAERKVDAWRQRIAASQLKLTDDKKATFLELYRQSGELTISANAIGVTRDCIHQTVRDCKIFAAGVDDAKGYIADHVYRTAKQQSSEGINEHIIGGKDRDELLKDDDGNYIFKKTFPNNPILQMDLKRTNPEFREKTELDVNISGGVLVAPADMSVAVWTQTHAKIVDTEATEKNDT